MLALVVAAPMASAATNPYGPVRVCGSSYRVVGQHAVTGPAGGVLGVATFSEVSLAAKGGRYMADNGDSDTSPARSTCTFRRVRTST